MESVPNLPVWSLKQRFEIPRVSTQNALVYLPLSLATLDDNIGEFHCLPEAAIHIRYQPIRLPNMSTHCLRPSIEGCSCESIAAQISCRARGATRERAVVVKTKGGQQDGQCKSQLVCRSAYRSIPGYPIACSRPVRDGMRPLEASDSALILGARYQLCDWLHRS
jgi:hypothetical protein